MKIIEVQEQIEILRNRLTNGTETYRVAIQKDMAVELVNHLFQRIKCIMTTLRSVMVKYEKLINDEMAAFTILKNEQPVLA
jgi:hypothetical protein